MSGLQSHKNRSIQTNLFFLPKQGIFLLGAFSHGSKDDVRESVRLLGTVVESQAIGFKLSGTLILSCHPKVCLSFQFLVVSLLEASNFSS